MGLREAYDKHLSETVAGLEVLRIARANDPEFPGSVGKRGAAFRYRVGDLEKWARNRPRATKSADKNLPGPAAPTVHELVNLMLRRPGPVSGAPPHSPWSQEAGASKPWAIAAALTS
ncbi:hypothetical protein ABZ858_23090 [Streptomyces sp. NPDC047017]|uniref:hypothetical protein n=1 Tax=Streptomyces sp. NPDC047017 TaxID=3155024 RepID=UPI0033E6CFA2